MLRAAALASLAISAALAVAGCDDEFAPSPSGATTATTRYSVTFAVSSNSGILGHLSFEARSLDGLGHWGRFGPGSGTSCNILVPAYSLNFDDTDDGRLVATVTEDALGWDTPTDVARCTFTRPIPGLRESDFQVTVTEASPPGMPDAQIGTTMEVSAIRQHAANPSPEDPVYDVTLSVVSESGPLGALQFDTLFLGTRGGWVGAGAGAACISRVDAQLYSVNDVGGGLLKAALVDLDGFPSPGPILTCMFKTGEALEPSSFEITTIDASPPGLEGLQIFPRMAVTEVIKLTSDEADD